MVQTPTRPLTLEEFLLLPETELASEYVLEHRTHMGWLIDPDEHSVFVYLPDQPTTVYDKAEARLPVPEFAKEFNLTVATLFGWLME